MLIQKNKMIERYLTQTHFTSEEDFRDNLHFVVPETFNFAYDVMDEWAKVAPDKLALLWTSERGEELRATYAEFKEQTDQAAAYFLSLGIRRGDKVMLILKTSLSMVDFDDGAVQDRCCGNSCNPYVDGKVISFIEISVRL